MLKIHDRVSVGIISPSANCATGLPSEDINAADRSTNSPAEKQSCSVINFRDFPYNFNQSSKRAASFPGFA
jgi:hypothetical protein